MIEDKVIQDDSETSVNNQKLTLHKSPGEPIEFDGSGSLKSNELLLCSFWYLSSYCWKKLLLKARGWSYIFCAFF
jgi:hypothetical protein